MGSPPEGRRTRGPNSHGALQLPYFFLKELRPLGVSLIIDSVHFQPRGTEQLEQPTLLCLFIHAHQGWLST